MLKRRARLLEEYNKMQQQKKKKKNQQVQKKRGQVEERIPNKFIGTEEAVRKYPSKGEKCVLQLNDTDIDVLCGNNADGADHMSLIISLHDEMDSVNECIMERMHELHADQRSYHFFAFDTDCQGHPAQSMLASQINIMKGSWPADLEVRIGSYCMLTSNVKQTEGWTNGTLVKIKEIISVCGMPVSESCGKIEDEQDNDIRIVVTRVSDGQELAVDRVK
jgi:hypothetical protein